MWNSLNITFKIASQWDNAIWGHTIKQDSSFMYIPMFQAYSGESESHGPNGGGNGRFFLITEWFTSHHIRFNVWLSNVPLTHIPHNLTRKHNLTYYRKIKRNVANWNNIKSRIWSISHLPFFHHIQMKYMYIFRSPAINKCKTDQTHFANHSFKHMKLIFI